MCSLQDIAIAIVIDQFLLHVHYAEPTGALAVIDTSPFVYSFFQIRAVASVGMLPRVLAYRHPTHGSPVVASIMCAVAGFALCILFTLVFQENSAQDVLLTASLFPAVIAYMLVAECLVRIRQIENRVEGKHRGLLFHGVLSCNSTEP
jgi:amino acid transporter